MRILAIESSCDETAASIVENGTIIISSVVASSAQMHQKYGGIVPEVAARKQLESIIPVLEETLLCHSREGGNLKIPDQVGDDTLKNSIDVIAVTVGPGLIGSLLIGIETAKTLAFTLNKPIIPVNHVLAHMYASFINQNLKVKSQNKNVIPDLIGNLKTNKKDPRFHGDDNGKIQFPAVSLVVSGGHTELYLMESESKLKWLGGTIDDAAGECFDKSARILGFGSKGGLAIQQSTMKADLGFKIKDLRIKLPRPMLYDKTLNFSFSGLKTALMREVNKLSTMKQFNNLTIAYLSHELQEAITDVLVYKTMKAVEKYQAKSILISGGVASNLRLREKLHSSITRLPAPDGSVYGGQVNHQSLISFSAPPPQLCTDNAVFIASYAYFYGKPADWRKITAIPDLNVEI